MKKPEMSIHMFKDSIYIVRGVVIRVGMENNSKNPQFNLVDFYFPPTNNTPFWKIRTREYNSLDQLKNRIMRPDFSAEIPY